MAEQIIELETAEQIEARIKADQKKLELAKKMRGAEPRSELLSEVQASLKQVLEQLKVDKYGPDFDEIKPAIARIDENVSSMIEPKDEKGKKKGKLSVDIMILVLLVFNVVISVGLLLK